MFKYRKLFFCSQRFRSRSRSTTPPHWKQEQRRAIPLHKAKEIDEKKWSKGETVAAPTSDRKEVKDFDRGRDALSGHFGRSRHDSNDALEEETYVVCIFEGVMFCFVFN